MKLEDILADLKAKNITPTEAKSRIAALRTSEKGGEHGTIIAGKKSQRENANKIAVIGMAGQFPGADNVDQFWDNLKRGVNSIKEVPESRWPWS